MDPRLVIRMAREDDVEEMACLLGSLFFIEKDFTADLKKQEDGLRMLLSRPEQAVIFVADCEGIIAGMATGQILVSTAEGAASVKVEDVVVKNNFQRQGIGKALMSELASWTERMGARRMELLVDCTNLPALEFYKKLGWKDTKMVCRHYFPGKAD